MTNIMKLFWMTNSRIKIFEETMISNFFSSGFIQFDDFYKYDLWNHHLRARTLISFVLVSMCVCVCLYGKNLSHHKQVYIYFIQTNKTNNWSKLIREKKMNTEDMERDFIRMACNKINYHDVDLDYTQYFLFLLFYFFRFVAP